MSVAPFDSKGVGEALKELGIKGEITSDKSKVAYSMAKANNWSAGQVREYVKKQKEEGGSEDAKFSAFVKSTVAEFSKNGDYDMNQVVQKIRQEYPTKFTEKADEKIREMVYSVDPAKKDSDNFKAEVDTLSGDAFDGHTVTYQSGGKEVTKPIGDYVKEDLLAYYDKSTVAGILIDSGVITDANGNGKIEGDDFWEIWDNSV